MAILVHTGNLAVCAWLFYALCCVFGVDCFAAEGAGFDEEITVVAPTPGGHVGIAPEKLPFNVQSADSDALERAQSLDLTDFLSTQLASVNINSAQGNPLQPDLQYRGYTASPLLGLPMGIAVYQNGVRINEPLGDSVNWDLLPESAIHSLSLIGGANPLFGLNALGGALSIVMKNGFNFERHALEFSGGSWGRHSVTAESGANNETFGFYANVSYFYEDGWRDLSASNATNLYAALSWRGAVTNVDFTGQYGGSELRGNGPAPVGLIAIDRKAIFTAPDITDNDMHMFTADFSHAFDDAFEIGGNAFYRSNHTDSFNGDTSEFLECMLDGGDFLIEGLEPGDLDDLGFDEDDLCADNILGGGVLVGPAPGVVVTGPESLEDALNALAMGDVFAIDDLTDSISGTGILGHDAINNQSARTQKTYGMDMQLTFTGEMFGHGNYLVAGFAYFKGEADFDSVAELSAINPQTRSSAGLGVGSFVDEVATDVATETATWSVYFLNAMDITNSVTVTLGGRFNDTAVTLRDRSGARPELNGEHKFKRFNPSVGLTYSVTKTLNLYAGYSESSRAPTPIELACNEGVLEIARDAAIAKGDDPSDIDFECRLPNAFLADPPLDEVVAKSFEVGLRGDFGAVKHRIGYFHTTNRNDIVFQSTGRSTGLFANVGDTIRQGVEIAFAGGWHALDWSASYSYIGATFGDAFAGLSPMHEFANDDGEIQIDDGDRIPGIPAHQLKLGGDYHVNRRIGLGFDFIYNSDQVLRGDESNQLDEIAGYTLLNLRATIQFRDRFNFFVRVTNLFDTDYENFGLLGEDPSAVISGLVDNRPRFLGVGAERGVWAGVRLSFP